MSPAAAQVVKQHGLIGLSFTGHTVTLVINIFVLKNTIKLDTCQTCASESRTADASGLLPTQFLLVSPQPSHVGQQQNRINQTWKMSYKRVFLRHPKRRNKPKS